MTADDERRAAVEIARTLAEQAARNGHQELADDLQRLQRRLQERRP